MWIDDLISGQGINNFVPYGQTALFFVFVTY